MVIQVIDFYFHSHSKSLHFLGTYAQATLFMLVIAMLRSWNRIHTIRKTIKSTIYHQWMGSMTILKHIQKEKKEKKFCVAWMGWKGTRIAFTVSMFWGEFTNIQAHALSKQWLSSETQLVWQNPYPQSMNDRATIHVVLLTRISSLEKQLLVSNLNR